jgi:hypothetical protein
MSNFQLTEAKQKDVKTNFSRQGFQDQDSIFSPKLGLGKPSTQYSLLLSLTHKNQRLLD